MTKELIERSRRRHEFADVALIVTTVTLVVSLVIAFTAVSIGIARADTLATLSSRGSSQLALTMTVIGATIAVLGGLATVFVHRGE
jgi:hypothetical protein